MNALDLVEIGRRSNVAQHKASAPMVQDGLPWVVLRDATGNERIEYVTGRQESAPRPSGTTKLADEKSFSAYVLSNANAPEKILRLYGSLTPAKFVAVFNDTGIANGKQVAGWRDHRAEYELIHSREWQVWTKHDGQSASFNSPAGFAKFVEDNLPDIVRPAAGDMMQMALNIRINEHVQYSNQQRLNDGHVELVYNNIVDANTQSAKGGKIKIPETFSIRIPVWQGIESKPYDLEARLRIRLTGNQVTIWYELVRPYKVLEQAFSDTKDAIEKALKTPILFGAP